VKSMVNISLILSWLKEKKDIFAVYVVDWTIRYWISSGHILDHTHSEISSHEHSRSWIFQPRLTIFLSHLVSKKFIHHQKKRLNHAVVYDGQNPNGKDNTGNTCLGAYPSSYLLREIYIYCNRSVNYYPIGSKR
jgi:hypothetical protein